MTKKKVEIKIELDAETLEEVLTRSDLTENQKLAEVLPPDPGPPEPTVPNADPKEEVRKDAEWKDPLRPFKRYTLGKEVLNATKFQPIANRMFVFCMPGLDAFLVKKVERPPFIRPKNGWQEKKTDLQLLEEANAHKKLVVYLHECIAPSTRQQVQELIDATFLTPAFPLEVQIKMLDPVGTVIQLLTYQDVVIERVDYDTLTYEGSSLAEIKMTLIYRKEKLEF